MLAIDYRTSDRDQEPQCATRRRSGVFHRPKLHELRAAGFSVVYSSLSTEHLFHTVLVLKSRCYHFDNSRLVSGNPQLTRPPPLSTSTNKEIVLLCQGRLERETSGLSMIRWLPTPSLKSFLFRAAIHCHPTTHSLGAPEYRCCQYSNAAHDPSLDEFDIWVHPHGLHTSQTLLQMFRLSPSCLFVRFAKSANSTTLTDVSDAADVAGCYSDALSRMDAHPSGWLPSGASFLPSQSWVARG